MIKLFTHTDLDGIGCAVLAKLAFGDKVDIEYCNYDDVNEKVSKHFYSGLDIECHITDISIRDELAAIINTSKRKYRLLDHHPTAMYLNKYSWCNVVNGSIYMSDNHKTSGTEMYYKWLVDNGYLKNITRYGNFVKVIRDYDTYRWKSMGMEGYICKQVNDLFDIYGKDKFILWCMNAITIYDVFPMFTITEQALLDAKQREINNYVTTENEQVIKIDLFGRTCGVVFADRYVSELGNRLCQMNHDLDFVAMIDMNGVVSYRTIREDIDLGKDIATNMGGGGHPKAAGSRIGNDLKMNIINQIFGVDMHAEK